MNRHNRYGILPLLLLAVLGSCQNPTDIDEGGVKGEIVNVTLTFDQNTRFNDDQGRWALIPVNPVSDYTVAVSYYTVEFLSTDSGMTRPTLQTIPYGSPFTIPLATGNWTLRTRAYNAADLLVGYTPSQIVVVNTSTTSALLQVMATAGGTSGVYANTGDLNLTIAWDVLGPTPGVESLRVGLIKVTSGAVVVDSDDSIDTPVVTDSQYVLNLTGILSGDYLLTVYLYDVNGGTGIPLAVVGMIALRVYDGAAITYTYRLTAGTGNANLRPHALAPYSIGSDRAWLGTGINWACADVYASGFEIYRKRSVDPVASYVLIGSTGPLTNRFVDTGVTLSTNPDDMSFDYYVRTLTVDYGYADSAVLTPVLLDYVVYVHPQAPADPAIPTSVTDNRGWPGNPFRTLAAAQAYLDARRGTSNGEIRLFRYGTATDALNLTGPFDLSDRNSLRGGYFREEWGCDIQDYTAPGRIILNSATDGAVIQQTGANGTTFSLLDIRRTGNAANSVGLLIDGGTGYIDSCFVTGGSTVTGESRGIDLNNTDSTVINSVVNGGSGSTTSGIYVRGGLVPTIKFCAVNGGTGTGYASAIRINSTNSTNLANNVFHFTNPAGAANMQLGIYRESATGALVSSNIFSRCDYPVRVALTEYTLGQLNSSSTGDTVTGDNYEIILNIDAMGNLTGGVPAQLAFGADAVYSPATYDSRFNSRTAPYSIGPVEYTTDFTNSGSDSSYTDLTGTVSVTADTVDGNYASLSFREALLLANQGNFYGFVAFNPALNNQTIRLTLANGPLRISRGYEINGNPGAGNRPLIRISGDADNDGNADDMRIFDVDDGLVGVASLGLVVRSLVLERGFDAFGGVFSSSEGNLLFQDCLFRNNYASNDGSIYCSTGIGADIQFTRCRFENNLADYGGVIALEAVSSLAYFDGCAFIGNAADNNGGVVYVMAVSAAATFANCVLTQNRVVSVADGGSVAYSSKNGAQVNFNNCTLYNNDAGAPNLIRATNEGSISLKSSILWEAAIPTGLMFNDTGVPPGDITVNQVMTSDPWSYGTDIALIADPLFVNTAQPVGVNSPWDTATDGLRLRVDSPALDATGAIVAGGDITGGARQIGLYADLGAYESPYDVSAMVTSGPYGAFSGRSFTALCPVGNTLYAGTSQGYLRRYDITNPANPTLLDEQLLSGAAITKIVDSGTYLVVRAGGTLHVLNRTNGAFLDSAEPFLLVDFDAEGIYCHTIYDNGSTFSRFELPNLGASVLYGTAAGPFSGGKIDVVGSIGVILHSANQVTVFRTDTPAAPEDYTLAGPAPYGSSGPLGVTLAPDGTRFYTNFITGDRRIQTGEIVTTPTLSASWLASPNHQDGTLLNSDALFAAGTTRLYSVDSDNGKIDRLTDISLSGDGADYNTTDMKYTCFAANANYAFIGGEQMVQIFNMNAAGQPAWVSTIIENRGIFDIVVDGNYAYAAAGNSGVVIYDITNRTNPVLYRRISRFSTAPLNIRNYLATKIVKQGNYLVAALLEDGTTDMVHLVSFNVTNPGNPLLAGHYSFAASNLTEMWLDKTNGVIHIASNTVNLYSRNIQLNTDGTFGADFTDTNGRACGFVLNNWAFYGSASILRYYPLNISAIQTNYSGGGTRAVNPNVVGCGFFGGRLFVLSNNSGIDIQVIDYNDSDPGASPLMYNTTATGIPRTMTLRYPYALVSCDGGITLVNTGATGLPVSVYTTGTDTVQRTAFHTNAGHTAGYIYTAAGTDGLYVFSY